MGRIRTLVSSLFMTFSVAVAYSQEILTATLQHGDELTVYKGSGALSSAHAAAVDGDIIYLSPGTFNSISITKAVTVQGAGAEANKEAGTAATIIDGYDYMYVDMPDTTHKGVVLEGLYIRERLSFGNKVKGVTLRKCILGTLAIYETYDVHIDQCKITNMDLSLYSENFLMENSIVQWVARGSSSYPSANSTTSTYCFKNCYLGNVSDKFTAFYLNNIIGGVYYYSNGYKYNSSLPSTSSAYNNLFLESKGNADSVIQQAGNMVVDHADIYSDANSYVLTDEAAATYLGQDGTQVGIYGGQTPYSLVPTYPQIVENNIAAQSTADGILKVSVKVKAQSK